MKAMLYLQDRKEPVAALDEVKIVSFNDNHKKSPTRITYKTQNFNATKLMTELHRDTRMTLTLDDGRSGGVILQHTSLDMEGNFIGVMRVIDGISA